MNVLHLISGDLWAGAEVATYHLLVELSRRRAVDVSAIVLNEGELAQRLRSHGGIVIAVESERGSSFPALARRVRRRCREADLVHAHGYKENLLAALSGRPWLSTQHGRPEPTDGSRDALQRGLVHGLDQFLKRNLAQRVVAVSGEVQEWLASSGRQRRTALVPNGIPDPSAACRPRPWAERPRRVGAVARLFPVKGLHLAIDAVAAGPDDVELEILGDGPERAALERRAQERGCASRVHLPGHLPDPLPRMAEWRALLMTSLHEGNPISVLESLALGVPVISGSLRGVEDILGGEGGIAVPDRSPESWARTLAALLGDDEAGASLSRAARRRYETAWGVGIAAGAMARLYEEIATAPARRARSVSR